MSEKQPGKILESIREAYVQQFGQSLDERLLKYVVEKEIQKKREAFLQVQISMAGIGLEGLIDLKGHLKGDRKQAGHKPEGVKKNGKRVSKDILQNSVRKRAKEALELSLERADPEEYANLSEEEVQKQKRRAYARAYYHRKKKEQEALESDKPSVKMFKTTPEQRAYQRAYYKRKKEESEGKVPSGRHYDHSSGDTHAQEEESFTGRSLFKSDSADEAAFLQEHDDQKKSVDYDSMASDRMAIENAFRAEDLADALEASSKGGRSMGKDDGNFPASGMYPTKTKLRKAKHSLTT